MARKFIVLSVVAALLSGCVVASNEKHEGNPRLTVSEIMWKGTIEPMFYIAELADFYRDYRDSGADEGTALAMAQEYFGKDPDRLDSGGIEVAGWGSLEVNGAGFTASHSSLPTFTNVVYSVTILGLREFHIECSCTGDDKFRWKSLAAEATMTVDDSAVSAAGVQSVFIDSDDTSVTASGSDSFVAGRLRTTVGLKAQGTLHFVVSGGVSDSFNALCTDGRLLIEDNGI